MFHTPAHKQTIKELDAASARFDQTKQAADLARRRKADFDFMVAAHSKGNPAMYDLLRDRSLDKVEPKIGDQHPSVGDGFMSPLAFVGTGGTLMTECDFHRAAQAMERGGGFVSTLAALYYVADSHNQRKLREAFIDHFVSHHNGNVSRAKRAA